MRKPELSLHGYAAALMYPSDLSQTITWQVIADTPELWLGAGGHQAAATLTES